MKARSRTGKRFRSVQRNGPMTCVFVQSALNACGFNGPGDLVNMDPPARSAPEQRRSPFTVGTLRGENDQLAPAYGAGGDLDALVLNDAVAGRLRGAKVRGRIQQAARSPRTQSQTSSTLMQQLLASLGHRLNYE